MDVSVYTKLEAHETFFMKQSLQLHPFIGHWCNILLIRRLREWFQETVIQISAVGLFYEESELKFRQIAID